MSAETPQGGSDTGSPLADDTPDLVQDRGSNEDQDDDDLFGDDDDDDDGDDNIAQRPQRSLDDQELDSGDDIGRDDRVADTVEDGEEDEGAGRPLKLMDCNVPRINYPIGNEFYMLNLPAFLGIQQKAFDAATYEPQTLAHDGDPNRETSSYSTAMSSMFWRRNPDHSTADDLQSTARFIKWEDGSISLQLATKPTEQYKVNTTAMRQTFPKKLPPGTAYDPAKDSHTFLAAAHATQVIDLQLVQPLDASMKIQPAGGASDESHLRLRQALMTAKFDHDPLARPKEVREDPELARKAAEQFEKERVRAQKKRENAEERQTMKRQGVLGRAGLGPSRGAGLSVAGLEDDMGMPISRGTKKRRKTNRRGEIYSDDEDETMPRGRTREDEYDREDDFVVDSDEEPEEYDDNDGLPDDDDEDPDRDDLEIEGRETVMEDRGRRERTPKRSRMDEIDDDDDDDDAEGEPDDELLRNSPQAARKKRRVIDDDEDD